jgi:hypothetical protein
MAQTLRLYQGRTEQPVLGSCLGELGTVPWTLGHTFGLEFGGWVSCHLPPSAGLLQRHMTGPVAEPGLQGQRTMRTKLWELSKAR